MRDPRARLIVAALPRAGETVELGPEEAAHARARRLVRGDLVLLFDGSGRVATAEVSRINRTVCLVRVSEIVAAAPPGPAITLAVAGLRAERLAWVVEKATELGVARIVLLESGRTQTFRASPEVRSRLEKVARAAAKQCERAEWPALSGPIDLESALEDETFSHRLFLDFSGEPFPRRLAPLSSALLVGPEGGWTGSERRRASDRGWKSVTLPAGKLRAETAAISAVVLLRAALEE
ncbi:MAG TPA: RsmE family RNA methyltransferase [Thermoanaerobaculia bacterium]|nr:RsmE family RNA methyltransferase [Thermoanaerobaculia bacterium]